MTSMLLTDGLRPDYILLCEAQTFIRIPSQTAELILQFYYTRLDPPWTTGHPLHRATSSLKTHFDPKNGEKTTRMTDAKRDGKVPYEMVRNF